MPKIPVYERQVDSPMGSAAGRLATAADAGAERWQAVQQMGQAVQQVGDMLMADRERDADITVGRIASEAQMRWAEEGRKRQETAAAGGEGYTAGITADFDKDVQSLLEQAPTQRSRTRLESSLRSFGAELINRAGAWESQQRSANRVRNVVETAENRAKIVASDPSLYEQQRDQLLADVEAAGITPERRAELQANGRRHIAEAAGRAVIERDPLAFLQQVDPQALERRHAAPMAQAAPMAGDPNEPRGIRNNNPGNIRAGGDAWQGMTGDDGAYAVFATPEHGIRAAAVNLLTYAERHGLRSVQGIIGRWAPPSENDTGAYVAAVARALGVAPDAGLNLRDAATLQRVVAAIVQHENGKQPYAGETIRAGVEAALGRRELEVPVPQVAEVDLTTPADGAAGEPQRPKSYPAAWWNDLNLDDQRKLVAAARTMANQKLTADRAGLAAERRDLHASLMATGEGRGIPLSRYVVQFGDKEGRRLHEEDQRVRALGQFGQRVAGMTPAEQDAALGPRPGPDQPQDVYAGWEKRAQMIQQARKARDDDPAAYVARVSPVMRSAAEDAMKAQQALAEAPQDERGPLIEEVRRANRRAAEISLREQQRMGVAEPRILSDQQLDAMVNRLNAPTAPGESVAMRLDEMAKTYGDLWPKIYGELATRRKNTIGQVALVIGAGMPPDAAADLAEVNRQDLTALRDVIPKDKRTTLDEEIEASLRPLAQTLAPLAGGGAGTLAVYREQAERLALLYMRRGLDSKTAAAAAAQSLYGHRYTFTETGYRIPKIFDAGQIELGADSFRRGLTAAQVGDVPAGGVGTSLDRREAIARSAQVSGYWVTNSDESGLVLYVGNSAVLGPDGRPVEVKFADLAIEGSLRMADEQARKGVRVFAETPGGAVTGIVRRGGEGRNARPRTER